MSQEIIYTSSPQGLKPGSSGFCTVASTPGMAKNLAERLESFSGYRHLFPPGDSSSHLNPVAYSHFILSVGGQKLHVLSRVADAGLDYSHRTNKLAHHVALEAQELVPAGPGWVLQQPGFSETTWSGNPRILPQGRRPPSGMLAPTVCRAWQQVTGDAGWAGVLAQNAVQGNRPAHIIFKPGTDLLPLVVEAQSLMPLSKRWDVSFCTYFTRLPPAVDCQWRFVVAGSPEAKLASGLRGDLVIDLTAALSSPPPGPLVDAARTGVVPAEARLVEVATRNSPVPGTTRQPPRPEPGYQLEPAAPPPPHAVGPRSSWSGGPPAVPPPLPSDWNKSRAHKKTWLSRALFTMAACVALVLAAGLGGVAALSWFGKEAKQVASVHQTENPPETPKPEAVKSKIDHEKLDNAEKATEWEAGPGDTSRIEQAPLKGPDKNSAGNQEEGSTKIPATTAVKDKPAGIASSNAGGNTTTPTDSSNERENTLNDLRALIKSSPIKPYANDGRYNCYAIAILKRDITELDDILLLGNSDVSNIPLKITKNGKVRNIVVVPKSFAGGSGEKHIATFSCEHKDSVPYLTFKWNESEPQISDQVQAELMHCAIILPADIYFDMPSPIILSRPLEWDAMVDKPVVLDFKLDNIDFSLNELAFVPSESAEFSTKGRHRDASSGRDKKTSETEMIFESKNDQHVFALACEFKASSGGEVKGKIAHAYREGSKYGPIVSEKFDISTGSTKPLAVIMREIKLRNKYLSDMQRIEAELPKTYRMDAAHIAAKSSKEACDVKIARQTEEFCKKKLIQEDDIDVLIAHINQQQEHALFFEGTVVRRIKHGETTIDVPLIEFKKNPK